MKRAFAILRVAVIVLAGFAFTSCDEDIYTGSTLEGLWVGNMYATSEWDGRVYLSARTEIEFVGDPMRVTDGTGYWLDRYSNAPWDYFYSPFTYKVRNGVITIILLQSHEVITISSYTLNSDCFTGYLDYTDESFVLHRLSGGRDWSGYRPGYYDNGGYPYYNRAERDFGSQPDTVPAPVHKVWNKQAFGN